MDPIENKMAYLKGLSLMKLQRYNSVWS